MCTVASSAFTPRKPPRPQPSLLPGQTWSGQRVPAESCPGRCQDRPPGGADPAMAFLGRLVVWAQNHSGAPGPALWTAFPGPPVSWLLSQCGQCWENPGVSPLVGTAGPDPPLLLPGDPGQAPGNPRGLLLGRVQFSVLTSLCLGPTVMAILGQALPTGPISAGLPSTKGCTCGLSLFSVGSVCASNCSAACLHIFS